MARLFDEVPPFETLVRRPKDADRAAYMAVVDEALDAVFADLRARRDRRAALQTSAERRAQ